MGVGGFLVVFLVKHLNEHLLYRTEMLQVLVEESKDFKTIVASYASPRVVLAENLVVAFLVFGDEGGYVVVGDEHCGMLNVDC